MNNYKQKLSHLYELTKLVKEESIYSSIEHNYIKKVAERLEVDLDDLDNFEPDELKLDLPRNEFMVIPLFHRLVILIGIDSIVLDEERNFCFELGVKMGLHPQAVNEVIDIVVNNGVFDLTPQKITSIFNKFSN